VSEARLIRGGNLFAFKDKLSVGLSFRRSGCEEIENQYNLGSLPRSTSAYELNFEVELRCGS
jgi:hypothetical protein